MGCYEESSLHPSQTQCRVKSHGTQARQAEQVQWQPVVERQLWRATQLQHHTGKSTQWVRVISARYTARHRWKMSGKSQGQGRQGMICYHSWGHAWNSLFLSQTCTPLCTPLDYQQTHKQHQMTLIFTRYVVLETLVSKNRQCHRTLLQITEFLFSHRSPVTRREKQCTYCPTHKFASFAKDFGRYNLLQLFWWQRCKWLLCRPCLVFLKTLLKYESLKLFHLVGPCVSYQLRMLHTAWRRIWTAAGLGAIHPF